MEKTKIALAAVAATTIALSSGTSAFARSTDTSISSTQTLKKLEVSKVYAGLTVKSVDLDGITVQLPLSTTDENGKAIEVVDPTGEKVTLASNPKIETDKTVKYEFSKSLSEMIYGDWIIDGVVKNVVAYPDIKSLTFTDNGIKISLPDDYKGNTPATIRATSPRGEKVTLTPSNGSQIADDGTFTYTIPTTIQDVYGDWMIDGKSYNNKEKAVYTGLKVSKITKTGVTITLSKAIGKNDIKSINVFTPKGEKIELNTPTFEGTTKEVTYNFKTALSSFIVGTWRVDSVKYEASLPKIEAFKDLEVVSITPEEIILKSAAKAPFDNELSVKNPQGQEIAVTAPTTTTQKGEESYIIYKFVNKLETVATGNWTINTDTKFTVLSEDANKAKVKAAQDKIKKAKLTLSTNKNYVKNVLAAKAAVEALTYEQQELFAEAKEYNQKDLKDLVDSIETKYKSVKDFEDAVKKLNSTATDFVNSVGEAEKMYKALTKEQLSYIDKTVSKQYTAYLNEAAIQDGLKDAVNVAKSADKIIAFNKAYKKLSATQKESLLLNTDSKKIIENLTDKTLQKNAAAALAVQKKFEKLTVQKKNDKNKKLYYTLDEDGKPTKTETTTKTSEPVMVPSLSAVTKAQTALTALEKKNKAAYDLVDKDLLDKAKGDSTIKSSIEKGETFNKAVKAPSDIKDFVSEFTTAKTAYIALTPDEQKYAIDKNALKQYKAYLKIDKVAVMYDKMDDPEASTKSMKLAYTAKGDITSITNDVKFSKGKFTIPKGNYKFEFIDGIDKKTAYYKDGVWAFGDASSLGATPVTAQEVVAYAKAFNALKDDQEKLLLTSNTSTVKYDAYVGKEDDYKRAAAVEKKIATAVKSKKAKSIETAKKALDALTTAQKGYVSNKVELESLLK